MDNESIVEIIKNSGEHLSIDNEDLVHEIIALYTVNDERGMKELLKAYDGWVLENYSGKSDLKKTYKSTRNRMDFVCEIADEYLKRENFFLSLSIVDIDLIPVIGPVRRFYRDAVDYHPGNYRMN